jgi:hypothetical protein
MIIGTYSFMHASIFYALSRLQLALLTGWRVLKIEAKILLTETSPRVDVGHTSLLELSLTIR